MAYVQLKKTLIHGNTSITNNLFQRSRYRQVQLGGFVSFNFSGLNFPKPSRVGAARQKVINTLNFSNSFIKKIWILSYSQHEYMYIACMMIAALVISMIIRAPLYNADEYTTIDKHCSSLYCFASAVLFLCLVLAFSI